MCTQKCAPHAQNLVFLHQDVFRSLMLKPTMILKTAFVRSYQDHSYFRFMAPHEKSQQILKGGHINTPVSFKINVLTVMISRIMKLAFNEQCKFQNLQNNDFYYFNWQFSKDDLFHLCLNYDSRHLLSSSVQLDYVIQLHSTGSSEATCVTAQWRLNLSD